MRVLLPYLGPTFQLISARTVSCNFGSLASKSCLPAFSSPAFQHASALVLDRPCRLHSSLPTVNPLSIQDAPAVFNRAHCVHSIQAQVFRFQLKEDGSTKYQGHLQDDESRGARGNTHALRNPSRQRTITLPRYALDGNRLLSG